MATLFSVLGCIAGVILGQIIWSKWINHETTIHIDYDPVKVEVERRKREAKHADALCPWIAPETVVPNKDEIVLVRPYADLNSGIPVPGVWLDGCPGYWRVFNGADIEIWSADSVDSWMHIPIYDAQKEASMT